MPIYNTGIRIPRETKIPFIDSGNPLYDKVFSPLMDKASEAWNAPGQEMLPTPMNIRSGVALKHARKLVSNIGEPSVFLKHIRKLMSNRKAAETPQQLRILAEDLFMKKPRGALIPGTNTSLLIPKGTGMGATELIKKSFADEIEARAFKKVLEKQNRVNATMKRLYDESTDLGGGYHLAPWNPKNR
jgi:hypothetical protein